MAPDGLRYWMMMGEQPRQRLQPVRYCGSLDDVHARILPDLGGDDSFEQDDWGMDIGTGMVRHSAVKVVSPVNIAAGVLTDSRMMDLSENGSTVTNGIPWRTQSLRRDTNKTYLHKPVYDLDIIRFDSVRPT